MTVDEVKETGLPLANYEPITILQLESGIEWLSENTTLDVTKDVESIKALPSCARLFLCRFVDLYSKQIGVTSESIAGMSQSFDTTAALSLLWQLAYELLGKYLKSGIKVTPARSKWG